MILPKLFDLADQKYVDLVPVQVHGRLFLLVLGVVVGFIILKINYVFARKRQLVVVLRAHVHVLGKEFRLDEQQEISMLATPVDFFLMRLEEFETLLNLFVFAQLLVIIARESPNIFHFKIKRTLKNFGRITEENTTSFVEKFNRNSATTDGVGKVCEERVGGNVALVILHAFSALVPLHYIRPLPHLKSIHLLLLIKPALIKPLPTHGLRTHFENGRQQLLVAIVLVFLPVYVQQVPA